MTDERLNLIIQVVNLFIDVAGFLTLILITVLQHHSTKTVTKREIYQQLELASIDLFRFEFEHSERVWPLYSEDEELPPVNSRKYRDLMNHVTQILNLFEMIVMFRREKIISPAVFASWVAWFWDMTQTKNFVKIWEDNSTNYTRELQFVLNSGIASSDWNEFIDRLDKTYRCKHIQDLRSA